MIGIIKPSLSHVKRAFRSHDSQLQALRAHGPNEVVLGARVVVPDNRTAERGAWRDTMRAQAELWSSLTAHEKETWNDYARRYGRQLEALRARPSCEPFHGYRVFTAATSNLLAQALPVRRIAPEYGPFDFVPDLSLTAMQPVLTLRVQHKLGLLSGFALQLRMAPPAKTRVAKPKRRHVRPICGTVLGSTFLLPSSGETLEIPDTVFAPNPLGRTGIEARILRLADGMPGPWAWFIFDSET